MIANRRFVGDYRALLLYWESRLFEIFNIENNDVVVATLNIHCRFSNWSVKIQPFDPILKVFESVVRIQYFFEKPFFIFFVVQNYFVGLTIVLRIDSVLINYRYIEDGEYTMFG